MTGKSRLKDRMAARADDGEKGLTERDRATLAEFLDLVSKMVEVLDEENKLIEAGQFDSLPDAFRGKAEIATHLEIKQAIISQVLSRISEDSEKEDVQNQLTLLRDAITKNGLAIERISAATTSVVTEIKRIKKRHSLNGLYEQTGKVIENAGRRGKSLDQEL